jgi:hypothetical protein
MFLRASGFNTDKSTCQRKSVSTIPATKIAVDVLVDTVRMSGGEQLMIVFAWPGISRVIM